MRGITYEIIISSPGAMEIKVTEKFDNFRAAYREARRQRSIADKGCLLDVWQINSIRRVNVFRRVGRAPIATEVEKEFVATFNVVYKGVYYDAQFSGSDWKIDFAIWKRSDVYTRFTEDSVRRDIVSLDYVLLVLKNLTDTKYF